jgi:hypothetical protein
MRAGFVFGRKPLRETGFHRQGGEALPAMIHDRAIILQLCLIRLTCTYIHVPEKGRFI